MATQTTNYGLTKPNYNETADIGVINSNMDIIDAKMKENADNVSTLATEVDELSITIANNQDWLKGKNIWSLGDIVSKKSGSFPLEYVPFHIDKGTYTFFCTPNVSSTNINTIAFLDSSKNTITSIGVSSQFFANAGTIVLEFTRDVEYINSYFREVVTYAKIQLEKGNEKTDYTPYCKSNVELANEKADNNIISDAWNDSTTYAVGQYCIYDNSLWKCLVQHSGQTPKEGTYWTKASITSELIALWNAINA